VRGFTRLGSSLSVVGECKLSSGLELNLDAATNQRLNLEPTGRTYITYNAASTPKAVEHYVDNSGTAFRSLALTGTGGTLHGIWSADVSLTLSDRRVKTDIEPIATTLHRAFSRAEPEAAAADFTDAKSASWVLRELRPVSFRLKTGPEAKYVKFGFIAQELERLFPDMVRTDPHSGVQQVIYQDLLAVLTMFAQAQEARQKTLEAQVAAQQRIIDELQVAVRELSARVTQTERKLRA
jgi:hypothetical protein